MANRKMSHTGKTSFSSQSTSTEDKAAFGTTGITALSHAKVFSFIWQVKLRLQFTGWLQYIPFALIALVFFLAAGLVRLIGSVRAANPFDFIGGLFLAVLLFDLITVKFRIRPREYLPKRKDDLDVFDLMRTRRSCRSFQTRKLRTTDYNELMEYVRFHSESPTIGRSPVRFEYVCAPLTIWPVVNATEFLVAIAPKIYDRLAVIDVGRSLQKIVMYATRMGLATCWIGPGADHASIMRALGDRFNPEEDHIICVCAIGYKSWFVPMFLRIFNVQFHNRLALSSLFFADPSFKKPLNTEAYPFNQYGRNYEICQWAPSSYNGQTTRCAAITEQNGVKMENTGENELRLKRFDFYSAVESRYYAPVAVGIWCANWEMGCEALGIHGHFVVLSAKERNIQNGKNQPQLPRYEVSWILEKTSATSPG